MIVLIAKHNGNAQQAREEMAQMTAHLLGPGQTVPDKKFFKRNEAKFLEHHTVEDLVIF